MSNRLSVFFTSLFLLAADAHPDVRETKHNLTGRNFEQGEKASLSAVTRQNQEICVFCHTPGLTEQGGGAEGEARVAKWQRSVDAAFTFELFDDIGAATGAVGSVSLACLSCHDSVQAFGVTPGSASDHPFGVPYRGSRQRVGAAGSIFRGHAAGDSNAPSNLGKYVSDDSGFHPVRSGTVNKRQIWWASVTDTGQRSKSDLPLYPRRVDEGLIYEQVPFVECTSCHDPHSSREVFLRRSNDQSKLCLTCHVK